MVKSTTTTTPSSSSKNNTIHRPRRPVIRPSRPSANNTTTTKATTVAEKTATATSNTKIGTATATATATATTPTISNSATTDIVSNKNNNNESHRYSVSFADNNNNHNINHDDDNDYDYDDDDPISPSRSNLHRHHHRIDPTAIDDSFFMNDDDDDLDDNNNNDDDDDDYVFNTNTNTTNNDHHDTTEAVEEEATVNVVTQQQQQHEGEEYHLHDDDDHDDQVMSNATTINTNNNNKDVKSITKVTKKRPAPLRRPPSKLVSTSNNQKKNTSTTGSGTTTTTSSTNSKPNKRVRINNLPSTVTKKSSSTNRAVVVGGGDHSEKEVASQQQQAMSSKEMTTTNVTTNIEESGHPTSTLNNTSTRTTTPAVSFQQQQQQQSSTNTSMMSCPNCGSTQIEQHEASGATVCTDCGVVVEENAIVSSIEFVEGTGGSSNMVGQFVSATSSKAYTSGAAGGGSSGHNIRGGGRYGFSRDSRETTLVNGRRRIQELASRLRLSSHYIDSAHRLFTVAVERNFVQGRRTSHVVAACLYIACRQEKSQHMLIDFSDALQVNVYTLGTCFLKFRRLLGLKLEIIDPALYVYRFAAHLDLDDRANAVSLTSLRLVARMKRDWIVAGRRPAGICAAALLIAARAHGFDKHCADVTRILRVCGMTVTNRIREFERTPTAHLSLEQFQTIDFEAEADPPIYTKNKIREARAKAIQEQNIPLLTSGVLDDDGKRGSRWRATLQQKPKALSDRAVKFQELYETLDKKLNDEQNDKKNNDEQDDVSGCNNEEAAIGNADVSQLVVRDEIQASKETAITPWKDAYPKHRGKDMILPSEATVEEQLPSVVPTESKLNLSQWKLSLPNEIDLEIEDFFRSSKEEKEKEAIFNKINKDYIAQQERKESERLDIEAAAKDQDADDIAQAAGHARYKDVVQQRSVSGKSRNRGTNHHRGDNAGGDPMSTTAAAGTATTTEEQLRAAVASRKVSRKINYDALSSIFDDDGSFATTDFVSGGDRSNDVENENDDYDNSMNQDDEEMY